MKFTLCLFVCAFISMTIAHAEDDTCGDETAQAFTCWENFLAGNKEAHEGSLTKLKDNINKCFKETNCAEPDYTLDAPPNIANMFTKGTTKWATFSDKEKACVTETVKEEGLHVANECLDKKSESHLHPKEFKHFLFEFFKKDNTPFNRFIKSYFQSLVAVRKCRNDKGVKAAENSADCLANNRHEIMKQLCTAIKACETNFTKPCLDKRTAAREAICSCRRDDLADVLGHIENLQKTKKDVQGSAVEESLLSGSVDTKKRLAANLTTCFEHPENEEIKAFVEDTAYMVAKWLNDPSGPSQSLVALAPSKKWVSQSDLEFLHHTFDSFADDCNCRD